MCDDVFKGFGKLDPFDILGRRKKRAANADAANALQAEQDRIQSGEEKKRKR